MNYQYIRFFSEISKNDIPLVGGKNASLGEMFNELSSKGINIPDGFALTTNAYWHFLKFNDLDQKLKGIFGKFNPKSVQSLQKTGKLAREAILKGEFPDDLKEEIINAYEKLSEKYKAKNLAVAVRSSGVAEDAPTMSFAGQFESFLNISGKENLLAASKKCLASAFADRVIAYRQEKKVSHLKFALSVGVQKMVRSDLASAGVMFTLDTETGFSNVVLINSVYGVGEEIVKGHLIPDEFYVFKPTNAIILKNLSSNWKKFSLSDKEILKLAKWAQLIENHYQSHQDIEWAKDGKTGELFVVQARPETVHTAKTAHFYEEYQIKTDKKPVLTGIAVGNKIGQGRIRKIPDVSKISQFKKGEVLVTKMTDPDWLPAMRIASAIVTDEGGRTSHAAIVSRELGLPAIVGAKVATKILKEGKEITVDCSQGTEGKIFLGKVPYQAKRYDLEKIPKIKTKIMVNIGAPEIAFKTSFLPVDGVGLARQEFIIAEKIRIHPLALYHYKKLKAQSVKLKAAGKTLKLIEELTVEHRDKREYFVKELAEGIAQIAAAFWPKPVILRLSDLKTNEYRALIGGELFEPQEENPMLGWRGASRYYDPKFIPAFKMELEAIKRAREVFGLKNIKLMIPFCRTPKEGKKVLELMKEEGLERGKDDLEVYVMAEIPSNVILADKFLDIFDGMSIGSNDLTQLVLGLDRDSSQVAQVGDERDEAVKEMVAKVIQVCKKRGKYSGTCGEAPSSFPEFAQFLVQEGIDSISLNPDSVIKVILNLANKDKK
jgi:pyruvate,water dikinase